MGSGARVAGRSAAAYERAVELLPGGVNSPVRAMRSIGRDPIFVARGEGAELIDVDGNRYVDWVMSWGPLIAGHAHPEVVVGGDRGRGRAARASARPPRPRSTWPPRWSTASRRAEMVRMTSSGTEASMSAIRLARAVTGRDRIVKFAGAYHGHVDGLLADAGSGLATQGIPASPGVTRGAGGGHDRRAVERPSRPTLEAAARRSASRTRPTWAWSPPAPGFLAALREYADRDGRAADLRRGDHRLPRGAAAARRSARA